MPNRKYREFTQWNVNFDDYASRLSMADAWGQEYFAFVPRGTSALKYREAREKALDTIEAAIEAELGPGEVKCNL